MIRYAENMLRKIIYHLTASLLIYSRFVKLLINLLKNEYINLLQNLFIICDFNTVQNRCQIAKNFAVVIDL